jgi:LuxR family transcriptional regulator, quorum-sensing system regulator CciR
MTKEPRRPRQRHPKSHTPSSQTLVGDAQPTLLSDEAPVRLRRTTKKNTMNEAERRFDVAAGPATGPGTPSRAQSVEIFSRLARMTEDRDQLRQAFGRAVQELGFDHFALQGEGARLLLADLPANWIFRPDPARDIIFSAAARSLSPFLWSDIPRFVALSRADARAVENGPPGFAVPIHAGPFSAGTAASPGLADVSGFAGCCSFLVRRGAILPVESFAAAHYIATLALEGLQRVDRAKPVHPRLTPRQRDCMILAAQGKSDWEIGKLLGISESTVHKHIEDAKRRFGVSTRIQLIVRGLAEARLSFTDILGSN